MTENAAGILLQLGDFQFTVDTAAYQQLQRDDEYRWASMERIRQRPRPQWIGLGETRITLDGVIYPLFSRGFDVVGTQQIEAMREQAARGEPLTLTDGRGNVYGEWVITAVSETASVFLSDGTPRKQEFSLTLLYYEPDPPAQSTNAADTPVTDPYQKPARNRTRARSNNGTKIGNPLEVSTTMVSSQGAG